jgi:hypothetical protein
MGKGNQMRLQNGMAPGGLVEAQQPPTCTVLPRETLCYILEKRRILYAV